MFDYMLKIQRARRHLKDLEAAEAEWRAFGKHSLWTEPDPHDPSGRLVFYATAEQPPAYPISVLIGDWLHNWRSALGALALQLAVSFTSPLPDAFAKVSEFPIFGDEDRNGVSGVGSANFHKTKRTGAPAPGSGLFKIQGWNPQAQAAVERLQPYQRGPAFREDPLWIVHELNIMDKHRALHTVAAWSDSALLDPRRSRNYGGSAPNGLQHISVTQGPVETRTEIGRMALQPLDPELDMRVEVQNSLRIAFGPGNGRVEFESVVPKLGELDALLFTGVLPALEKFL